MEENRRLELSRQPNPEDEAAVFENPDEKRLDRAHRRDMEKLEREQGNLGAFLGTTNTSLKIAFIVISVSGACLIASAVGTIWIPELIELAKLGGTIMLTVAGYVFGVKSN